MDFELVLKNKVNIDDFINKVLLLKSEMFGKNINEDVIFTHMIKYYYYNKNKISHINTYNYNGKGILVNINNDSFIKKHFSCITREELFIIRMILIRYAFKFNLKTTTLDICSNNFNIEEDINELIFFLASDKENLNSKL